eukprot:2091091-Rhodomonas_salina.1
MIATTGKVRVTVRVPAPFKFKYPRVPCTCTFPPTPRLNTRIDVYNRDVSHSAVTVGSTGQHHLLVRRSTGRPGSTSTLARIES